MKIKRRKEKDKRKRVDMGEVIEPHKETKKDHKMINVIDGVMRRQTLDRIKNKDYPVILLRRQQVNGEEIKRMQVVANIQHSMGQ